MKEYKLIVAGGRDFSSSDNYKVMEESLFKLLEELPEYIGVSLISGGARGADRLAEDFARIHDVKIEVFKANWDVYGKLAGYFRNREMGDVADGLLAFWDGKSKGTEHMIKYMESLDKPVHIIGY